MTEFIHRSVPTEVTIKPGDGRIVEAYAAVFNTPAEIRDHQGHYNEVIDRSAFNMAINMAKPSGKRTHWLTNVFYNHGMTLHGTPSEMASMPIGRTQHIEADSIGVLTVTRYLESPFADSILEAIREGAITAQSFTGRIIRSDPNLSRGQQHRASGGKIPTVTRLELGLSEYGPTPIPAYADAAVVGVRSLAALLGTLQIPDLSSTPDDEVVEEPEAVGTDSDDSAAADEPLPEHSVRSNPDQLALMAKLRARGITQ